MDFVIPADDSESKRIDKYVDLARKLKVTVSNIHGLNCFNLEIYVQQTSMYCQSIAKPLTHSGII